MPGKRGAATLTSAGNNDIFLARYRADGQLGWVKRAGGSAAEVSLGLAALPDGHAYVTGYFAETATFGPGEAGQTVLTSAGGNDIFLATYRADGTLDWVRGIGGAGYDSSWDVAALSHGAVITGYFNGNGRLRRQ